MATIKDIARLAGVSTATVSMVLNGKDCITKKTKEKVMAAAREVDYIPSFCGQVTEDEAQLYHRPFCRRYCKPVFPGNYQRGGGCRQRPELQRHYL